MTELEKLIKQKKELEAKIRLLKTSTYIEGCLKVVPESHSYNQVDWKLCIQNKYGKYTNNRNTTILTCESKEILINQIDQIMSDFQGLKEQLQNG